MLECRTDVKHVKTEISLTERDLFCQNMRFSDNNSRRTGCKDNIEKDLVLDQKVTNSEQSNEENFIKIYENFKSSRTDLKNLVRSEYNGVVENIPDLLKDFNIRYPGYKQVLGHQDLQEEAEKLNSWGWT